MNTESTKQEVKIKELATAIGRYIDYLKDLKSNRFDNKQLEERVESLKKEDRQIYYNLDLNDEKVESLLVSLANCVVDEFIFVNTIKYSPFYYMNYENYKSFLPKLMSQLKISDENISKLIYDSRLNEFDNYFSIISNVANHPLKDKVVQRLPFLSEETFFSLLSVNNPSDFYSVFSDYARENNRCDINNLSLDRRMKIFCNEMSGFSFQKNKFGNFLDKLSYLNNLAKQEVVEILFRSEDQNTPNDFILKSYDSSWFKEQFLKNINDNANFFNVNHAAGFIIKECYNKNPDKYTVLKSAFVSKLLMKDRAFNFSNLSFLLTEDRFLLNSTLFMYNENATKPNLLFNKPSKADLKSLTCSPDLKDVIDTKFMLIYMKLLDDKYKNNYQQLLERNEKEIKLLTENVNNYKLRRVIIEKMILLNDKIKFKVLTEMLKEDRINKTDVVRKRKRI